VLWGMRVVLGVYAKGRIDMGVGKVWLLLMGLLIVVVIMVRSS
jgi:hypothetical protein